MVIENKDTYLYQYAIFRSQRFLKYVGITTVTKQNLLFTIVFAVLMFCGGIVEQSLVLKGKNIGLLEHPGNFSFLILQAILPYLILRSIGKLKNISNWGGFIIKKEFFNTKLDSHFKFFSDFVAQKYLLSKIIFSLFLAIGFFSFSWNSFQNQAPIRYLGFDFWDSIHYPLGYWITRVHKAFLWIFFLPALAHLEIAILITIRRIIISAWQEREIELKPFNEKRSGVATSFLYTVITPIIPILILETLHTAYVSTIQNGLDFTLLTGLIIMSLTFLFFYFFPSISLRKIIVQEKKRYKERLALIQNKFLQDLMISGESFDVIKERGESIEQLEIIVNRLDEIPNWPRLDFVIKTLSFINTPLLINVIIKLIPFFSK